MIKRLLQIGVLLASFASMPSWGIAIVGGAYDGTNVGSVDFFEDQIDKATFVSLYGTGGSPEQEQDWVNDVLSPDIVSWTVKTETIDYFATDMADVYAFELAVPYPEYFLIKNSTHRALFQNLDAVEWGVFDVGLLVAGFNLPGGEEDVWTISHVTQFGEATTVPEPSMIALLAIGLLGVAVACRKKTI